MQKGDTPDCLYPPRCEQGALHGWKQRDRYSYGSVSVHISRSLVQLDARGHPARFSSVLQDVNRKAKRVGPGSGLAWTLSDLVVEVGPV